MLDLMKKLAWIALISFLITGCVTQGIKEDEKQDLATRDRIAFSQVRVGMSAEQFHHLFPKAYFVGPPSNQTAYVDGSSYTLPFSQKTHFREETITEKLRFHFVHGRLVSWQQPSAAYQKKNIEFN